MQRKFWEVPDEVWFHVERWIPAARERRLGGRPRVDNRRTLEGIIFRLKTGCQWKAIPEQFGSSSTIHRRFQEWVEAGVFHILFYAMVRHYDGTVGADLAWCSLDGVMVKAPKGGSTRARVPVIAGSSAPSATF